MSSAAGRGAADEGATPATRGPSVKARALRHLARREHSRAELERKLARQLAADEVPDAEAQIARALDELAAHGLLSDERAAAMTLSSRQARFGERRLKADLQAKGLAAELVAGTLAQARGTELQRAQALWQRRFGSAPADAREHQRQVRFLLGRGFAGDVVRRVVQGADDIEAFAPE
jgi:regulatory protein